MVDKTVTFEVHYGGELTRHPTWKYLGGELDVIDPIDEDLVCFFDIEDMLKVYGYVKTKDVIFYKKPELEIEDGAFVTITNDKQVKNMLDIFEHYPTIKIYIGHHGLMDVENSVKKTPRKEKTVMIIEEEDSYDDVEVDDEELDDMDRLATEVYTESKQPSDEDMPYVDEEDRRYWEGLLSENEDLFDVHLPDMQPTGGNVNIQVGAGCTSNLLQLVGDTTNNVNMEIPAEAYVSECMESDDEIGSGKPNYEEFIEFRDMAKPHICLGMLFASVDVFRRAGLAEVFKKFIPTADHRICVRHLYANFRDRGHRGKALKDKLWEAAAACTETEYLAAMEELKKIDEAAYNYLDTVDQSMCKEKYMKAYNPIIYPVPDEQQWEKTGLEKVEPPFGPQHGKNTIDSISSLSMPLVTANKVASPNKQTKKGVGSEQGRAFFVGDEHGNVVHPKQKKRPRESGPSIQPISKRTLMSNIRSTQ
ncbi:hypothetical protein FCV25MIE_25135 [Fagus crenata]